MNAEDRLALSFARSHALEAAQIIERLPAAERSRALAKLPLEAAVAVLRQMEASVAAAACSARSAEEVSALICSLPGQYGARLLRRLEESRRQEILALMPADASAAARRLLHHGEDTAGALMDPRITVLPVDITVGEARRRVQREPRNLLYYLYVVDRDDRLVGVVNVRELLLARRTDPLAATMRPDVRKISVRTNRDAILANPAWRDFHALPVVDREGVLVGALRYETLRRLETDGAGDRAIGLLPVGQAFGELYWTAATAFMNGTFDALRSLTERRREESRDDG